MTKEEKINWLQAADTEELLNQYELRSAEARDVFEAAGRTGRKVEEILEDYKLIKEEIIRRMK